MATQERSPVDAAVQRVQIRKYPKSVDEPDVLQRVGRSSDWSILGSKFYASGKLAKHLLLRLESLIPFYNSPSELPNESALQSVTKRFRQTDQNFFGMIALIHNCYGFRAINDETDKWFLVV